MNTKRLLFLGCAALLLAGCASDRGGAGGTGETYDTLTSPGTVTNANGTVTPYGESAPAPRGSPTFRPGMNPRDPRDAQFIQRSQQQQSPPPTPP